MEESTDTKAPAADFVQDQMEEVFVLSTPNDTIGCAPIQIGVQKKVADNGLISLSNRNTLLATTVVIPLTSSNPRLPALKEGDVVYLDARCVTLPWAKSQYEIEGKKVTFVPVSEVAAVRRKVKRFKKQG